MQVCTDRHYTSTQLIYGFAKRGVQWIGTATTHNRSFLPKEVMDPCPKAKAMKRSECVWMHTKDGIK